MVLEADELGGFSKIRQHDNNNNSNNNDKTTNEKNKQH